MTERDLLLKLRADVARLAVEGKAHVRGDSAADADLHVTAEVREQLTGPIDGSNRTFYSTRIPIRDAAAIPLLVLRGLPKAEGDGWTQSGLVWWLTTAPKTDGFTDARPIAIYRCDPRAEIVEFDPALSIYDDQKPRRRRPIDDGDREFAAL